MEKIYFMRPVLMLYWTQTRQSASQELLRNSCWRWRGLWHLRNGILDADSTLITGILRMWRRQTDESRFYQRNRFRINLLQPLNFQEAILLPDTTCLPGKTRISRFVSCHFLQHTGILTSKGGQTWTREKQETF